MTRSGPQLWSIFLLLSTLILLFQTALAQTSLTQGVAVTSSSSGTNDYKCFLATIPATFPTDAAGITISLTPQGDGDPDC
jgi:hypothetical protein